MTIGLHDFFISGPNLAEGLGRGEIWTSLGTPKKNGMWNKLVGCYTPKNQHGLEMCFLFQEGIFCSDTIPETNELHLKNWWFEY